MSQKKQEGPNLSLKHKTFTMRTEGILFWMFLMKSFHFSFIFFSLLFKTRRKASRDFQSALVFITPRAIRVDSAHNLLGIGIRWYPRNIASIGALWASGSHGPLVSTQRQKNWGKASASSSPDFPSVKYFTGYCKCWIKGAITQINVYSIIAQHISINLLSGVLQLICMRLQKLVIIFSGTLLASH